MFLGARAIPEDLLFPERKTKKQFRDRPFITRKRSPIKEFSVNEQFFYYFLGESILADLASASKSTRPFVRNAFRTHSHSRSSDTEDIKEIRP